MAIKRKVKPKREYQKKEKFLRFKSMGRKREGLKRGDAFDENIIHTEDTTIGRKKDGKIESKGISAKSRETLKDAYYKEGRFKAVSDPKAHDEGEEAAIHNVSRERIRRLRKKSFEEKLKASGRKKKRKSSIKKKQEERIRREPKG